MQDNEPISAFAYKTAKQIEELIQDKIDSTIRQNIDFQYRIFKWYEKTKDDDFAEFFGINMRSDSNVPTASPHTPQ